MIQRATRGPRNKSSESPAQTKETKQFKDNRPEAIAQRKLQDGANSSTQVTNLAQLQANTNAGNPAIQMKKVYRMGSGSDQNLCPRPEKDTVGDGRGLSTSSAKPNDKAQVIETDNLGGNLEAVNDHGKHYAIRPTNDDDTSKLTEWANSRDVGGHELTEAVKAARVGTVDTKGNEKSL